MAKRILFILDDFLPVRAAPAVRIHSFLNELNDFECHVIGGVTGKQGSEHSDHILISRPYENKPLSFLFFLLKLQLLAWRVASKQHFDVIVISVPKYELLWSASSLKKLTPTLVIDIRDSFGFLNYSAFLAHFMPKLVANPLGNFIKNTVGSIFKRALKSADLVTVANKGIRQSLPLRSSDAYEILNGVDTDLFQRKSPNVIKNEINIVYLGNFAEKDDFSFLISVLPQFTNVHLHLIGEGRNKPTIIESLKNAAILFTDHGVVAHDKLPQLLALMNLGILFRSGHADASVPVAFFEFASMNIPSVCNRVGLMAEFVQENNLGFIVNNEQEFFELLSSIKSNPDQLAKFNYLHQAMSNQYSRAKQAQLFHQLLDKAL